MSNCKVILSLKNIDWKLFIALIIMGLCPAIYSTVRIYFLGNLKEDSESSYSIAGQLTWINLIYEVINESLILPLFYFTGKVIDDKKELSNRIKTGLIVTFLIYLVLSTILIIFTVPLLNIMAANPQIIDASATYIRIEVFANIFSVLYNFCQVGLITIGKDKLVYILTIIKLLICIILDLFLVSTFSFSFNLGVNGIGFSNILVNLILFITSIILLHSEEVKIFSINKENKLSFIWMKNLAKIGGISGFESFIRNLVYMVMIVRIVNEVKEQGTFWVANNFVWGWMLLPMTQLGELIKKEVSTNNNTIKNNTIGYILITIIFCLLWTALIPLYKPFMKFILNYKDIEKLFELVKILLIFYYSYSVVNIFSQIFYGLGKTNLIFLQSFIVNFVYFGIAFIFYKSKKWIPSLNGIAYMFDYGNAFGLFVMLFVFGFFLKKNKINILEIQNNQNENKENNDENKEITFAKVSKTDVDEY